jgi:hypothetical protein
MNYLSLLAKATGVGLAIWLLGRAIRTGHRLDRVASTLRWSVVTVSGSLYALSFHRNSLPDGMVWAAILAFALFFFLPDVSYYLVRASRAVIGGWRTPK